MDQCSGVSVAHANYRFLGVEQYRTMPNRPPPLCTMLHYGVDPGPMLLSG